MGMYMYSIRNKPKRVFFKDNQVVVYPFEFAYKCRLGDDALYNRFLGKTCQGLNDREILGIYFVFGGFHERYAVYKVDDGYYAPRLIQEEVYDKDKNSKSSIEYMGELEIIGRKGRGNIWKIDQNPAIIRKLSKES